MFDRYADIFIITGIFAWGTFTWTCEVPAWAIGVFAMTGVLMSSYLGTQAKAVGLKRNYGGIFGPGGRRGLFVGVGAVWGVGAVSPVLGCPAAGWGSGVFVALFLGRPALGWLLVIFGVFGHVTAVQRFVSGWRELNAPRKE